MTYEEALEFIIKSYRGGSKGGFERCERVLAELGDPHKKLRVIHVAGTNGKGSACAFLQGILMEAGYSAGMFTSPHLYRFNERFRINGAEIPDKEFADMTKAVSTAFFKAFCHGIYDVEDESLSYFEIMTIMAFYYFYIKGVDVAIIETGMGGRHDATNIIENPLLSIITSISLDHTKYLGDTISAITAEKSGIIKKNCPVVLYFQAEEVYNVISDVCNEKKSTLFYCEQGYNINIFRDGIDGIEFSVSFSLNGEKIVYEKITLSMSGKYQIYNAAGVLCAVQALNRAGLEIGSQAVQNGLRKAVWPGRMEIAGREPLIILEGAHNPDGARAAAESMAAYFSGKKVTLVTGVLKDKDYSSVINTLSLNAENIILTQPAYSVKAIPPATLYEALDRKKKVAAVINDFRQAVDTAAVISGREGVVFVSGSLYLVGDVKRYLEGKK